MKTHLTPIRMGEEGLDEVTYRNHAHQSRDHRFYGTEPVALQRQDQVGDDPSNEGGIE